MATTVTHADVNPQLQHQRRDVLTAGQKGAAGLPVLIAAMKSPNALMRRTAVRSMGEIGLPAKAGLADALKNDKDELVRDIALSALVPLMGADAPAMLQSSLDDSSELVRAEAVQALADMHPYTPVIMALLQKAQRDPSGNVSNIASRALFPVKGEGSSLRDRPEFEDRLLTVVKTIDLPLDGWHFQKDINQIGQNDKWFAHDFDASKWQQIRVDEAWDNQIGGGYNGVGWYRRNFTLPAKSAQVGTGIIFGGVDETAWVWINGQYVGQHDIGLAGWDKPFTLDVSDVLKWGQENQITVRVLNRLAAGGIWKPVALEVLKQ